MAFTAQLGTALAYPSNIELATIGAGATTYFITGSGGTVLGGSAGPIITWVGIGGVTLGGAGLTPTVVTVVGTGGVSLSGSATASQGSIPPGLADPDRRLRKDEVTVFRIGFGD